VIRRWRGGDQVLVRMGGDARWAAGGRASPVTWVRGRVLRAPCEAREGRAVTVDCDDGWRRYIDPSRLRPALRVVEGA
jgi:hypothetical protein